MTIRLPTAAFLTAFLLAPPLLSPALLAADRELPLQGLFPPPRAANVCPDSPLRITLDAPPTLAKGTLKIWDAADNRPIQTLDLTARTTKAIGGIPDFSTPTALVEGNTLHIFPTQPLAYAKTYFITLDPGALASGANTLGGINNPDAWRFRTKNAPPAAGSPTLTVSADSSGDFATIQAALDFIPAGNHQPVTITVKKGTYREIVAFTARHNITLTGEDRKQTILAFPNNANANPAGGPYRRGLFLAHRCDDLTITNMTFHNTTPRGGSQAETLILGGTATARAILANLDLVSFQDTLQINGQAFVKDCYIEGDVDFLWGTGPCYFENVTCKTTRSRAYFTQIRNTAANHGYVFNKCTFVGADGVVDNVLSRIDPARFPHSEVVLIDCTMTGAVSPAAWRLDNLPAGTAQETVTPAAYPNIRFWEFNSRTPDGHPVDTSQRHPISRQLQEPADTDAINNYRNPTWVLGNNWTPKLPEPQ